jgi:hypothetical protein
MPNEDKLVRGDPRTVEDCAFARRTIEAEGFHFSHRVVGCDGTLTDHYLHVEDLRSGRITFSPDTDDCTVARQLKDAVN